MVFVVTSAWLSACSSDDHAAHDAAPPLDGIYAVCSNGDTCLPCAGPTGRDCSACVPNAGTDGVYCGTDPIAACTNAASRVLCPPDVIFPEYVPPARPDGGAPEACPMDPECTTEPGMDQVCVPGGVLSIGDDESLSDGPALEVYVSSFWIDRTEVTVGRYRECVAEGACSRPSLLDLDDPAIQREPVRSVAPDDMLAFCAWAGGRLPTQAEWERAARGDDGRTYPWGEEIGCEYANWAECAGDVVDVGSYPIGASPYGALDMIGNVAELTSDEYDAYGYHAYDPPLGVCDPSYPYRGLPETAYVAHGCGSSGEMSTCTAYRREPTLGGAGHVGFRCVRDG